MLSSPIGPDRNSSRAVDDLDSRLGKEVHQRDVIAAAHHGYGQYLASVDRLDDALNEYGRARGGYEMRLESDPAHARALGTLSLLMKNAGAIHQVRNRLDLALASYQRALELDDARLAKDPDSVQARMNKTFALGSIAGVLGDDGRTREAIEYHRRALAIREEISTQDPANASAFASMLRSRQSIGRLQVRDDPAAATATLLHAQRVVESRPVRTRELDTVAAWIYASLGEAYHRAAGKAGLDATRGAEARHHAIASYERSRTAFETLRASGNLAGPDANALADVTKMITALRAHQ